MKLDSMGDIFEVSERNQKRALEIINNLKISRDMEIMFMNGRAYGCLVKNFYLI